MKKRTSKLKLTLAMLFVTVTFFPSSATEMITPAEAGYSQDGLASIKDRLDLIYEDGRIPNYVIALFKGGDAYYLLKRGNTSVKGGRPVSTDTIYWMASMSKPIVSTAIFRLIEEGKLQLESELSDFYPEFERMFVAPGGDFDSNFEEANRRITVLDLLTHTSGLTYGEQVIGFGDVAKQYDELNVMSCTSSGRDLQENVKILAQIPLIDQPGESFNYSVGIDVLGAVIEKITGTRLSDYLTETIFAPIGMKDTTFYVPEEDRDRLATVYVPPTPDNPAIGQVNGIGTNWKVAESNFRFGAEPISCDSGGGGIYSTAHDYSIFLTMVANEGIYRGTRILSEQYARLHLQNLTPHLGLREFRRGFGDAAAFMTFGGGFGIKKEVGNAEKNDYYFWGGAANTFFWIDGDDRSVGLFLTHHYPPQYNISDEIEQIVDGARL